MPDEITLTQLGAAKLRRDRAVSRIANLKHELKEARKDLAAMEDYYDLLVSDLVSGQACLPLGELRNLGPDAEPLSGIDLVTSRPGSTPGANGVREPVVDADGKVATIKSRPRRATVTAPPAVPGGKRKSAMLPEGRQ